MKKRENPTVSLGTRSDAHASHFQAVIQSNETMCAESAIAFKWYTGYGGCLYACITNVLVTSNAFADSEGFKSNTNFQPYEFD